MRMAALACAAVLASACGGGGSGGGSTGNDTEIKMTAAEFVFTPKDISAPAGKGIKLTIKNTGTVEHDFTIDSPAVKIPVPVAREVSKSIGTLPAGTYAFWCTVAGHKEGGMTGTLTVK